MAAKNQTKTEKPEKSKTETEEMNPLAELAGIFLGTLLVGLGLGLVNAVLDEPKKLLNTDPVRLDDSPASILRTTFATKEHKIEVQ